MSSTLYVGNLEPSTTIEDLGSLFTNYGDVENINIVEDRETGRPKGFGFVTFTDNDAADKAIAALNGSNFKNRVLRVNIAQTRSTQ